MGATLPGAGSVVAPPSRLLAPKDEAFSFLLGNGAPEPGQPQGGNLNARCLVAK